MRNLAAFTLFLLPSFALGAGCNLDGAQANFDAHNTQAIQLINPTLVTDVKNCFNPGGMGGSYYAKALNLFGDMQNRLTKTGTDLHAAYAAYKSQVQAATNRAGVAVGKSNTQSGDISAVVAQDAAVVAAANAYLANLDVAKQNIDNLVQTVKQGESRMTSDGFTTSDATSGGQPKYPNCTSQHNDNPAGNWQAFLNLVHGPAPGNTGLPTDLAAVRAAVTCQQSAVSGVGATLQGRPGMGTAQ